MNPFVPSWSPDSPPLSSAQKSGLAVLRVTLTNFRSYAQTEIQTQGVPVVLTGPNGAGKTNLLDAISLLSPGRGMRGAQLSDHTRLGPSESETLWAVAATVARGHVHHEIGTGLTRGVGGQARRQVRLNGAATQGSADLGEIVQVVWLTPAMDRLFSDGAGERRRFFDRLTLAFEPGHANTHTRYHAALRERAKLLKFGPRDPVWLDGLEDEMAVSGTAIAAARARTVLLLNRALSERSSAGTFPAAQLELSGEIDSFQASQGPECEPVFRKRLNEYRVRDAQTGRTNIGPHLSDIEVRHTAKRMDARGCSTGEQKALLISIVLAHARELARARDGVGPILLLDEIAAHLDSVRRVALFDEILLLGTQAWMTGTDRSLFDAISGHAEIYAVADGQLIREA